MIAEGTVTAIDESGKERILKVNGPVFEGDEIVTGPGSRALIQITNGPELAIGEQSVVVIDDDVTAAGGEDTGADVAEQAAEVAAIQAALEAGEALDLDVLPATAAGVGGPQGAGGGRKIVEYIREVNEVDPGGFAPTIGPALTFLSPESFQDELPVAEVVPPPEPAPPPEIPPPPPPPPPPDFVPTAAPGELAVDEEGLPGGEEFTLYTDGSDMDGETVTVSGNLPYSFGGNGPHATTPFTWSTTGLPALTSGGAPVVYTLTNGGQTLIAHTGDPDDPVFTLTLTNVQAGLYDFVQARPLDHDPLLGADTEDDIVFTVGYTVMDADGDTASSFITATVDDDSPEPSTDTVATQYVQEDALGNESADPAANDSDGSVGNLDAPGSDTDTAVFDLSGFVDENTGVDIPASVTYSIADIGTSGVQSAYSSNGEEIWYFNQGGALVARAGDGGNAAGRVVYTLSLSGSTATFDLDDQVDHSGAEDDDEYLYISDLGQYVLVSVTDFDNDTITTDFTGKIVVGVENDVPTLVTNAVATQYVQEDALGNESADPATDDTDASIGILDESGSDTDMVSFDLSNYVTSSAGADENATMNYNIAAIGAGGVQSAYTSNGEEIWYFNQGGALVARAGDGGNDAGRIVYTLSLSGSTATFDLDDQVDHSGAEDDDENLAISDLGQYVEVSITDADDDTITTNFAGDISIMVENDIPVLNDYTEHAYIANEAGLSLTGVYDIDVGADEPMDVSLLRNVTDENLDSHALWDTKGASGDYFFVKTDLNSGGDSVYYVVDSTNPDKLIATTDKDNPTDISSQVFTLTVLPDSDQYVLDMIGKLDETYEVDFSEFDSTGGGGPVNYIYAVDQGSDTGFLIKDPNDDGSPSDVTGTVVASFTTTKVVADGLQTSNDYLVQSSNAGSAYKVAVQNNWVEADEETDLVIDIGAPGLGQTALLGGPVDSTIDIFIDIKSQTSTTIGYRLYDEGGALVGDDDSDGYTHIETLSGATATLEISGSDAGLTSGDSATISSIELDSLDGGFRVGGFNFVTDVSTEDITESFVVDGEDADSDAVDTAVINVEFDVDNEMIGTEGDDVMVGGADSEVISGGGGDDVIDGGGGEDTIDGGEGDDTIYGGTDEDQDILDGGPGEDEILVEVDDPNADPLVPSEDVVVDNDTDIDTLVPVDENGDPIG